MTIRGPASLLLSILLTPLPAARGQAPDPPPGWRVRDLETDSLNYLAFVVDGDGRYRIYHRAGADRHEIQPWTADDAIVAGTAKNVLAAEVGADSLRFSINSRIVAAYERSRYVETDGLVGLRIHDGVEVHVTRLDLLAARDEGEIAGEEGAGSATGRRVQ